MANFVSNLSFLFTFLFIFVSQISNTVLDTLGTQYFLFNWIDKEAKLVTK